MVLVSFASASSITFAQFIDAGSQNFFLTNNTNGSQTLSASDSVFFSYTNVPGLPFTLQNPLPALFTFTATSNQNVGIITISGSHYAYIGGFTGTFQFTGTSGVYAGKNLLSGTFGSQTVLLGVQGGQSASLSDSTSSTSPGEVTFASNVVTFLPKQENFSISLSSIFDTQQGDAGFNVGGPANTDVDNFASSAAGTFASDPAPIFSDENAPLAYVFVGVLVLVFAAFLRRRTAAETR